MERFQLDANFAALSDDQVTVPRLSVHQCLFNFNIQLTPTAELFFSAKNRDALQGEVVRRVLELTERRISQQSEDELLLVMRSVYLQHAVNLDQRAAEEVRMLNARVLDYCVPNIVTNLSQYIQYLREVGRNPAPFPHAEYVSPAGLRGDVDSVTNIGPR